MRDLTSVERRLAQTYGLGIAKQSYYHYTKAGLGFDKYLFCSDSFLERRFGTGARVFVAGTKAWK